MNKYLLLALPLLALGCGDNDTVGTGGGARSGSAGSCGCPMAGRAGAGGSAGTGGLGGTDAGQAGEDQGGDSGTGGEPATGGQAGDCGDTCSGGSAGVGTSGAGGSAGQTGGAGGTAGSGIGGAGAAGAGNAGTSGFSGATSGFGGVSGASGTAGTAGAPACSNACPVELGTAGDFVILAKSGISTVPASAITGDIGVSPAAATYLTGWSLTMDASNQFATSTQIIGRAYAADMSPPTPSMMTTAIGDMEIAFTDAASRAADFTEFMAGDLSGQVLAPGVYKFSTGVLISTDVSLTGPATGVWIFEIAGNLTVANAARIEMAGGGLEKNVFWQVSGGADFGTTSHVSGIVLCQTAIVFHTGASMLGRALAQTAVTLDANTVTEPAP